MTRLALVPDTQHQPAPEPGAGRPRVTWPWLAAFAVVAAVGIVLHSPLLSVSRIEVVGAVESSAVSRVADSGVGEGALLLWVDTDAVRRAVEADPWVAAVSVERVWPNRLIVEVVERHPVAWIEGASGWMRVADDGAVIDIADRPSPDLVHVSVGVPDRAPGATPSGALWLEIVGMARVLSAAPEIPLGLIIEQRGAEVWTAVSTLEVRFGHPIDLADKARALVAMLGESHVPGSRIDITSPQRPAVLLPGDMVPEDDEDPEADVEG